MQAHIIFDPKHKKFFTVINGRECVLEFTEIDSHTLDYTRTYVPNELRGQGIAAQLVEKALLYAREHNKKVLASCSYVSSYLNTHPEFSDLIS